MTPAIKVVDVNIFCTRKTEDKNDAGFCALNIFSNRLIRSGMPSDYEELLRKSALPEYYLCISLSREDYLVNWIR